MRFSTAISSFVLGSVVAASGALALDEEEQVADKAYVLMSTNKGEIALELDRAKAPISVENFLQYVNDGHYAGTIFHRVIPTFMIQGGGFDEDMQQKPTRDPIKNEWENGLKNNRGTIAMARTNVPDSATCQFFINVVDNPALDQPRGGAAYAVFGKVVDGMDVVDAIKNVPCEVSPLSGRRTKPVETVVIESAMQITDSEAIRELLEAEARRQEALEEARSATADSQLAEALEFVSGQGVDITKIVETESGLRYIDIEVGEGDSPAVTDRVTVHYTGWLTDGTKFDSSRDRGSPITFARNGVIPGWIEALGTMKPGSKRYLIIPSDLGYGASGAGGVIPADAMLIFDVELIAIGQ